MFRLLLRVIMVAGFVSMSGCVSSDGGGSAVDIPLAELLEEMKRAADPRGVCADARSYILRQEMITEGDQSGDSFQVEVLFQKEPYFSKTTVYRNGKPFRSTLYNGVDAWLIDFSTGTSSKLGGIAMRMIAAMDKIGNPAYTYSDVFPRIELSKVISGVTEYYKLDCYSADTELPPLTVYVNKNNFLTRKVELSLRDERGAVINYRSSINEYALYSGIMMPETITVVVNGVESRYRMLDFRLNEAIPPAAFALSEDE